VNKLTAVSLFAGVGGFDLALRNNGYDVVASVEIDKKCNEVLALHFPDTKRYTDIKEVKGKDLINDGFNPTNGIITGGFPCQDLSVAGKRAGLSGSRSGLFWEAHRLLEETKSENFILENVPGLLSSNGGKDFGVVLRSLAELGYSVGWRVFNAQYFGVPQRRRRVFIVGSRSGTERIFKVLFERGSVSGNTTQSKPQGQDTTREVAESFGESSKELANNKDICNCIPAELYHKSSITNQDINTGMLVIEKPIVFKPHQQDGARIQTDVINTLTAQMGTGGNNVPMLMRQREGKDGGGKGPLLSEDKSLTLATANDQVLFEQPIIAKAYDEFNDNISDTHHTLRSGTKQSTGVVTDKQVRRLTPKECERLQGFPDDWTSTMADSNRYKQMGNAVAVPVVNWLVKGFNE
jgi:DNA (cytosine-5)-methyltransferase 1